MMLHFDCFAYKGVLEFLTILSKHLKNIKGSRGVVQDSKLAPVIQLYMGMEHSEA